MTDPKENALIRLAQNATVRDVVCWGCQQYQALYGQPPAFIAIRPELRMSKDDIESICAPMLGVIVRGEREVLYLDEAMIVRHWI